MPRVITVGYQWPRAAIRAMRSPAPKKRYQSGPPAMHARCRIDAASDPAPARTSVGFRFAIMCLCGLTTGVGGAPDTSMTKDNVIRSSAAYHCRAAPCVTGTRAPG